MDHAIPIDHYPTLDVDDIVERVGFGPFQARLLFNIGVPLFADCMEIFLIAFVAFDIQREFGCSDLMISVLSSSVFVGMFFGSILFGMLSDHIGRKETFTCAVSISALGGFLNAQSNNPASFLLTRGLCGLGIGGSHIGVTLFTEFLPTHNRSRYSTAIQFFGGLGAVLECGLAWALHKQSWRWLVRCTAIPAVVSIFNCLMLPQSPRLLLTKNRPKEAVAVYRRVAICNGRSEALPPDFRIRPVVHTEEHWSFMRRIRALHDDSQTRRLTWSLCFVWFTVSFSYYGLVFLSATMPASTRGTLYQSLLIISLAEFPAYYLAHRIARSRGRRSGMTICALLGLLTMVVLSVQDYLPTAVLLPTMFVSRCAFAVLFAITVLYTPEAFPTAVRSTACGLTNACSRIAGAMTPFVSFRLRAVSALAAGAVYVSVLLVGVISTQCLPFDTTGRALRDVFGE